MLSREKSRGCELQLCAGTYTSAVSFPFQLVGKAPPVAPGFAHSWGFLVAGI